MHSGGGGGWGAADRRDHGRGSLSNRPALLSMHPPGEVTATVNTPPNARLPHRDEKRSNGERRRRIGTGERKEEEKGSVKAKSDFSWINSTGREICPLTGSTRITFTG